MLQQFTIIRNLLKNHYVSKLSYATEAVFKIPAAKLYRLTEGPSTEITISKDLALHMYREMQVIRKFENIMAKIYKMKLIRGFCHLYVGQEAVAVGMKSAISGKDTVITSYRCHGWTYVMGVSPLGVLAELMGRESGCARGKGGSMHLYADNFYGGNGIVGAQVPLGTGLGLMHKYTNNGGINVCLYGDGAANQGQVAESFNIAKLLNLPVLYTIENNVYGMGTATHRSSANTAYYTRGDLIPGLLVDGMSVECVRAATIFARDYIVSGKGPLLLEFDTYRYFGHSMSDPGTSYRTREEVKKMRETRDPIKKFHAKLLEVGLATEDELKKIEADVKKETSDAEEKAKKDKELPMKDLFSDVYAVNLEKNIRNTTVDVPGAHFRVGQAINLK